MISISQALHFVRPVRNENHNILFINLENYYLYSLKSEADPIAASGYIVQEISEATMYSV